MSVRDILVRFSSYDGGLKTARFKTLDGARRFAQKYVGKHPDISETYGYAVSDYGDAKIQVRGATLQELFPSPEELEVGSGPIEIRLLSRHHDEDRGGVRSYGLTRRFQTAFEARRFIKRAMDEAAEYGDEEISIQSVTGATLAQVHPYPPKPLKPHKMSKRKLSDDDDIPF